MGGFGGSPRSGGPRVLAARAPHRALPGHHLVQPPGDPRNLLLLAHHHLGGGGLRQLSLPARPRPPPPPPPPRCAVQTSPGGRVQHNQKKKKSLRPRDYNSQTTAWRVARDPLEKIVPPYVRPTHPLKAGERVELEGRSKDKPLRCGVEQNPF